MHYLFMIVVWEYAFSFLTNEELLQLYVRMQHLNLMTVHRTADGMTARKSNGLSRLLSSHCAPNQIPVTTETPNELTSSVRFQPFRQYNFLETGPIVSRGIRTTRSITLMLTPWLLHHGNTRSRADQHSLRY